jgi:hypothetical protein
MTLWIDRADLSRTQTALFAPADEASTEIPPAAWTELKPPF